MSEYFKNVKVDDEVYSVVYGWGKVINVAKGDCFLTIFNEDEVKMKYPFSFKGVPGCLRLQTLFYSEPNFDLPPEPIREYKINYTNKLYVLTSDSIVEWSGSDLNTDKFEKVKNRGIVRHTEQQAEESSKRNLQANKLEALVYDIQGSVGGDCAIIFHKDYKYGYGESGREIVKVSMTEKTAIKICELLNSGKYKLG